MSYIRESLYALAALIVSIIVIVIMVTIFINMKQTFRTFFSKSEVTTETIHIELEGSNTLTITGNLSEIDETFDVFYELASGNPINLFDSEYHRYEYWFPYTVSKESKQSYRIVTASQGKDLLTLTLIGRKNIIRRYLEIDFSRQ